MLKARETQEEEAATPAVQYEEPEPSLITLADEEEDASAYLTDDDGIDEDAETSGVATA